MSHRAAREPDGNQGVAERRVRLGRGLLILVLLAALAHRTYLLVSTDFPINDGGLFVAFIRAQAASLPGIPAFVAYNGLDIPYAYPPLSFWIGGLLTRLGADPIGIVHVMPILMNAAYVLLFALLLIRSGRSHLFAAIALLFFCVTLRSFEWLVMGGGMSRGLGSIFLLATLLAIRIPAPGRREVLPLPRLALAGCCVAGAILSHLEWGIDAAACVILSRALGSPSLKDFIRSNIVAGLVALLLISPWVGSILLVHGVATLAAAGGASPWGLASLGEHVLTLVQASLDNPLLPVGAVLLLRRRDLFWPLFLLLCIVLTPRHAPTPFMLALAVFAAEAALCALAWLSRPFGSERRAGAVVAIIVAVLCFVQARETIAATRSYSAPLSRDARAAMAEVAAHYRGRSFAVINGRRWWYDSSAEWFPVLADATSVTTLQGREWLPDRAYRKWHELDRSLKWSEDCDSMLRVLTAFPPADFVWAEARRECFQNPPYELVYRNPQVSIFGVRSR